MKKLLLTIFTAILSIASYRISAQGTLVSIVPYSGARLTTIDLLIRGAGTSFDETTTFNLGGSVLPVLSKTVQDKETMRIKFYLDIPAGDHPFTISTKTGVLNSIFQVFEAGSDLNVVLNVVPLQSINASDFDPQNATNAPVLFTVSIFNDNTPRQNLKAVLTLSCDNYAKIGEAVKKNINIPPGTTLSFNNKEFNSYDVNSSNTGFLDKIAKSGSLPTDVYTYQVEIFDEKNNKVGSATGKNVIFNQISKPELISPGGDFSKQPEAIRQKLPLFQWFSPGSDFQFALYPINDGQTTPEEIVMNRPVFTTSGIKTSSFQYPASAEMLEEGKNYAWQIKLNNQTSNGLVPLASEVFWFKYSASAAAPSVLAELKITPEDVFLPVKQSQQFKAAGFTANNAPIKDLKVTWKVVPTDMGSIDENGLFTSSGKSGSCAVIAKGPGDVQEYATVNVSAMAGNDWTMKLMLQKLFGVPATK